MAQKSQRGLIRPTLQSGYKNLGVRKRNSLFSGPYSNSKLIPESLQTDGLSERQTCLKVLRVFPYKIELNEKSMLILRI